jgi:hypothetical protein
VKNKFAKDSIDSRYKALFAEETSVGLMAVVLSDLFGAKPINNTVEVIPPASAKKGPIADFVAQAKNPKTLRQTSIIAESKGSVGRLIGSARYVRAKQQVTATKVLIKGSPEKLPLIFGSTISFRSQKKKTRCLVTDPPAEAAQDSIEIDPVDAWRVAYAKTLKFVGLETASQQVLRGDPAEALRPIDFDRERDRRRNERDQQRLRRANSARQRLDMDLLLDVGQYALSLNSKILAVLKKGIDIESGYMLSHLLDSRGERDHQKFPGASFDTSLGFGLIAYSDLGEDRDRSRER